MHHTLFEARNFESSKKETATEPEGPGSFAEHFPGAEKTLPGEWCENSFTVRCEESNVEIGVYREPNDGGEYAGTLTLQIFCNDDVIFCERIKEE